MPKSESSTNRMFENLKNYKVYGVLAAATVFAGRADPHTYGLSLGLPFGVMTATNLATNRCPNEKSEAEEIVDKVTEEVWTSTIYGYGKAIIVGSVLLAISTLDWEKGNVYLGNGWKIMLNTLAGVLTGVLYGAAGTVLVGVAKNKLSDLKQSVFFAPQLINRDDQETMSNPPLQNTLSVRNQ